MRDPHEALAAARQAAAGQPLPPASADEVSWGTGTSADSARRLSTWAMIEPDPDEVVSVRRFGRPITALKRLLIRLLSQYLGQMNAQQSRFNASVAAHVIRLEERVAALEAAARERDGTGEPPNK